MENNIIESNKLIAEFMGAGFRTVDPFGDGNLIKYVEFEPTHHPNYLIKNAGRQFREQDLMYEKSWDWQIPVYSKLAKEIKNSKEVLSGETAEYFKFLERYEKAMFNNDILKGFDVIIQGLELLSHNQNK